ncbi:MAG TPA: plastocyanin/azurin family copper-binding protein [Acidimicrobiia bacterium]|jgi:plastocyanin
MTGNHHRRGFFVLAVLALALAGCGGDNNDTSAEKARANGSPAANEVVIRLIAFRPESLTVPAGTTVTWRQKDAGVHTVTSGTVTQGAGDVTTAPDGKFDSGNLATDATFEFTFAEAGTFTYFCRVHPATMRGQVQVT